MNDIFFSYGSPLSPDGKLKGHGRKVSETAKFQEIRRVCFGQREDSGLDVATRVLFVR